MGQTVHSFKERTTYVKGLRRSTNSGSKVCTYGSLNLLTLPVLWIGPPEQRDANVNALQHVVVNIL